MCTCAPDMFRRWGVIALAPAVLLAGSSDSSASKVPQSTLAIQISAASVPPGATAQIRVRLAAPRRMAGGSLVMDLDPSVFGPVSAVDVLSATGDQMGLASIRDRHVEAQFTSVSGGIGQLPGVPVMLVSAPVLASAKAGDAGTITFGPGSTPWKDVLGHQYVPAGEPGRMRVGGSLSVDSVTPGGGLLPAGTNVRIAGRGFAARASVQIEGVVVSATTLAGPQAIDIRLGAPADLTGKRVVVRNPDGTEADFYSTLQGKIRPDETSVPRPIFPLRTYVAATGRPMVQNPNPEPIEVTYTQVSYRGTNQLFSSGIVRMDPGGTITLWPTITGLGNTRTESLYSSHPVRMLGISYSDSSSGGGSVRTWTPVSPDPITPALSAYWEARKPSCSEDPFFGLTADPPCVAWLVGSTPPSSLGITVGTSALPTRFSASVATADGGQWATISPQRGETCLPSSVCRVATRLTLNLDPASLAPGEYTATITVTPESPVYSPQTLPLTLRVATGLISVQGPSMYFTPGADGSGADPVDLRVTSLGEPVRFSAFVRNPHSGWLSVTPSEGMTPETVTVKVDPAALDGPGGLNYVTIQGPANRVIKQVLASRREPLPPSALYTSARGNPVVFWIKSGATGAVSRFVSVSPYVADDIQVTTDRGGNWLTAPTARDSTYGSGLAVTVDPSGLAAGRYHGTIFAASRAHGETAPAKVDVELVIWAEPPPISVSPAKLVFSVPSGTYIGNYSADDLAARTLTVTSQGLPVDSTVAVATDDGTAWLTIRPPYYVSYGQIDVAADARNLPPGTYEGTVRISAPPGSPSVAGVPVTLHVTPALPVVLRDAPPLGITVANGASQRAGAVAPGEVLSIYGLNIGPATPAGFGLDAEGRVNTILTGARVLFDDVAAPILYASQTHVNLVVPYEVAGRPSVNIAVEFDGARTMAAGVPVAASTPGIFTSDGSGQGQAHAVNQDGSANSAARPAERGSTITILATGLGQTTPAGVTGEIVGDSGRKPVLPVTVALGGVDAAVREAVAVRGQVDGVFQLRVVVPSRVTPGPAVPVVVRAGAASSADGVTVAVN